MPERKAVRAPAVWAGIGCSLLAHIVIAGGAVAALAWAPGNVDQLLPSGALLAEGALFVAVMVGGIPLIVKGNQGLGLGLLIGWAIGFIVLPLIGMGVCVVQMTQMET